MPDLRLVPNLVVRRMATDFLRCHAGRVHEAKLLSESLLDIDVARFTSQMSSEELSPLAPMTRSEGQHGLLRSGIWVCCIMLQFMLVLLAVAFFTSNKPSLRSTVHQSLAPMLDCESFECSGALSKDVCDQCSLQCHWEDHRCWPGASMTPRTAIFS
jgi:hypothetical protein